jgi:hypothetical protein
LLLKRGDLTGNGTTDEADMASLYSSFGNVTWLADLNVDGAVNATDVQTMVTQIFRTVAGDFNLDGNVDGADYAIWRKTGSIGSGARYTQGDADLDGDVDNTDLAQWRSQFGFVRQALSPGSGSGAGLAAVPEPAGALLIVLAGIVKSMSRRNRNCFKK